MDKRPLEQSQATQRDHPWISGAALAELRVIVAGYLDGQREVDGEVERVAAALATAAHDAGYTPERMVISLRALWREFTFTQLDRLQLASLYDRLVRRAIDRYYED